MREHGPNLGEAMRAWSQLSDLEKEPYRQKAKRCRAVFNQVFDPVKVANKQIDILTADLGESEHQGRVHTPWGLGNMQWPLKPSTIEQQQARSGFVKEASAHWSSCFGQKVMHDDSFPEKVVPPEHCLNRLCKCRVDYTEGVMFQAGELLSDMKVMVCPRRSEINPGQFYAVYHGDVQEVVCIFSYLKLPFTFECLAFPREPRGSELIGKELIVSSLAVGGLLPLQTEEEWTSKVVASAGAADAVSWARLEVSPLKVSVGSSLLPVGDSVISAVEEVDLEEEKARQRRNDAVAAALRALDRSKHPWQSRASVKRAAKEGRCKLHATENTEQHVDSRQQY